MNQYPKKIEGRDQTYVADDIWITKEEKNIYHNAWIGTYPENLSPAHFHCMKCFSEDFMFVDAGKVCKQCYLKGEHVGMVLCVPVICGSS